MFIFQWIKIDISTTTPLDALNFLSKLKEKANVISQFDSFIIQLIKGKNEIIKEIRNEKQYQIDQVAAGEYSIRVFIDYNNNGKWDPGNIFKNVEPEGIFFYQEKITIRANWELTDINLEF